MKKSAFFLLLLLAAISADAQLTGAVIAGPHGSTTTPAFLSRPDTVAKSISKKTGLHLGVITNIPLYKNLFLQTGVVYSARGSKAQQTYDTASIDFTKQVAPFYTTTVLSANYIDLPFSLLYKIPLKGKTKVLLGAGPQASLFYNGSLTTKSYSLSQVHKDSAFDYTYKETANNDLPVGNGDGNFRTLHLSANAFAGLEFGRLFFTANYSQSVSTFYQKENQKFKHQSVGATVGIFLGSATEAKAVVEDSDKDGTPDAEDACPSEAGSALTRGCPDSDGDGISDKEDACPQIAGLQSLHGCPATDRDKDGIMDDQDACPDVAGLAQHKGCPAPDSDGDGITDAEDVCPQVAGLPKYKGCPVPDKDNDGVADELDACPDSVGTAANNGCPEVKGEIKSLVETAARQIQFEYGKYNLVPASTIVLDAVVAILKEHPQYNIVIEGHTSGAVDASNQKLSEQRAAAVQSYLVSKGISADRITATGYGSTRPANNANTPAAATVNRRVEMKLLVQ